MRRFNQKPNILLITTDTQRCDSLACYGNPHAMSPNLDRLAAQGVRFDQCHTASPVCGPTRCSLLTGTYPHTHGALENGMGRRDDLPLLPDLLAAVGYRNIMVGKTHFGKIPESFNVRHLLAGEKNQEVDDDYARFVRARNRSRASSESDPTPEELGSDTWVAQCAREAIGNAAAAAEPWFAWVSFLSPHSPYDPPQRWVDAIADRPLPPRRHADQGRTRLLPGLEELLNFSPDAQEPADFEKINSKRRKYYASCAMLDSLVGTMIDQLEATGQRKNTLVIFTSDHGTTLHDHGFDNKHNYFDSAWRVPLIISMPGFLPSGLTAGFAGWTDLTATILKVAGCDTAHVQGFDLSEPLRIDGVSPRRVAAASLFGTLALVADDWKLAYDLEHDTGWLIDRRQDPGEIHNLWDDPGSRPVRDKLLRDLLRWRAASRDRAGDLARLDPADGPVAMRVKQTLRKRRADEPERFLGQAAKSI